jgi:hypothetical protein
LKFDYKEAEYMNLLLLEGGIMLDSVEATKVCERLKGYPEILEKVKEVLDLVEKGNVESADDFEEALIPQVRKFGQVIVQTWATSEENTIRKKLETHRVAHHSKKNSTGIPPLDK